MFVIEAHALDHTGMQAPMRYMLLPLECRNGGSDRVFLAIGSCDYDLALADMMIMTGAIRNVVEKANSIAGHWYAPSA
jgi:hypothetical protein